ncbi:MAG: TonB-dependent receptor [Acidobacteria bacterium]|nr:TonB-dependent receptor [Acidobacteriota bacterium]
MLRRISTIASLLTLMCLTGWGQEFRATVTGRVLDSSGATIAGATVKVVNSNTQETSTATTDASGVYNIPFLRPGQYTATATHPGFKSAVRSNMTLNVSQVAGIDFALEVGQLTDSVTVEANAAVLETQTASRSGIIDNKTLTDLPLNARNPFMLGATQSGVTFRGAAIWQRPFDNGAIAEWSINGGQQSRNEFLMDGAPNNAQLGGNNIAYVPVVDAVQEFTIQTNSYDAAYGRTGGGVVNVVLKSGGGQHHGTVYEFMRRASLNANSFQNNALGRNSAGVANAPRPNGFMDQYGVEMDGPIYIPKLLTKTSKVKLFYMGSYEGYREGTPNPLRNSYAADEMRTGDFSKLTQANGQPILIFDPLNATQVNGDPVRSQFPNNQIPASRIDPVARNVMAFMPKANATSPGQRYSTTNFILPTYVNNDDFYNLILKFDWNFGDKHRTFIRHASNDRTEERCSNGICSGPGMDGQQPFQRINDAYVIDWVTTLNPTTVFNVRASYNRFIEKGFGRDNLNFDLTKLGLPSNLVSQLPSPAFFGRWDLAGYSSLGRDQGINITNNYGIMGSVTKNAGKHTLKAGVDVRRIHFIQQNSGNILQFQFNDQWTRRNWNQAQADAGDSFASFLLGMPSNFGGDRTLGGQQNFPLYPFYQNWYSAFYFQDDWKVNRKLTLNLGLRYDINMPASEKYNRLNRGFDQTVASPLRGQIPSLPNLSGGLNFAGVGGNDAFSGNLYKNTWQPRIGAAYSVNDRLVVRGGWGRYYMNPSNNNLRSLGFSTVTPIVASLDDGRTPITGLLSNPLPNGFARPSGSSLGANTFLGRDFNHWTPDFKIPAIDQFSLGIQFQVNRKSVLDLSYIGSITRNRETSRPLNIPSAQFMRQCDALQGGLPNFCNEQLPNPFLGNQAFRGTSFFTASTLSRYQLNRPFPQFNGNLTRDGLNSGRIDYNSLQVNYNVRMSGLTLITNYTWSRMLDRDGFMDPFNGVEQRALYFNDRPHVFKLTSSYDLPFGKGKKMFSGAKGIADKLVSGWQVTSFFQWASGEPANLPGNVRPLKDPRTKDINWNQHQVRGFSNCVVRQNNDGTRSAMPYSLASGCGNDLSTYSWLWVGDFSPGQTAPGRQTAPLFGNLRKHRVPTLDASLLKTTIFKERYRFQFGFEAFNAINKYYFGRNDSFNTNPNDANFGTLFPALTSNQNFSPRTMQVRLKFNW